MTARDEAHLDILYVDDRAVRRDLDEVVLRETLRASPGARRARTDELRLRQLRDARRVRGVIVMAVTTEDRVDASRDVARDREIVGDETAHETAEPGPREERIDDDR